MSSEEQTAAAQGELPQNTQDIPEVQEEVKGDVEADAQKTGRDTPPRTNSLASEVEENNTPIKMPLNLNARLATVEDVDETEEATTGGEASETKATLKKQNTQNNLSREKEALAREMRRILQPSPQKSKSIHFNSEMNLTDKILENNPA